MIQDPVEPGTGLLDNEKLLRPWKQLGQHVLHQVLGILLLTGKAVGKPVHAVQMGPDAILKPPGP
jgi:hypothetical protein